MRLNICHHRRGFTLVELLLVVTIIGILAALLFPAFGRVRERARAAQCVHNLHQLHIAYTAKKEEAKAWAQGAFEAASLDQGNRWWAGTDYELRLMTGWPATWLRAAGGNTSHFVCPSDKAPSMVPLGDLAVIDTYTTNLGNSLVSVRSIWEPQKTYSSSPLAGGYELVSRDIANWYSTTMQVFTNPAAMTARVNLTAKSGYQASQFLYSLSDWQGTVVNSNFGIGSSATVPLMRVSYGIQPVVFMDGALDTSVLLIEYPFHWVSTSNWLWTTNSVGRHFGKINVLYRSGTVEARTPAEMAPANQPFVSFGYSNPWSGSWIPYSNGVYWGFPYR